MEKDGMFSSQAHQRSRAVYIAECMFEYFVLLLMADAFLAKLLSSVGFTDGEIGVISSFISLAFVFQFFSLILARKNGSKKVLVLVLDTVGQMLFFALYVLPFLGVDQSVRRLLVYVCVIGAYACKYLVSSFLFQWANSFVHPRKRASYSAVKEIVSLVGGMAFSLFTGAVFDWYEASGNLNGGFIFLSVIILICNGCTFACLCLIKKDRPKPEMSAGKSWKDMIHHTFGNKNFRHLVVIAILAKCAQYTTMGFMGTFKTDTTGNGLALSMTLVSVIAMIGNLARLLVTKPFGKYSDKHSFAEGFYWSMYIAVGAFLCNVFTTEKTWYLIIGYTILFAVSAAGSMQNASNMTYSYVDADYIAEALALKNGVSGICGFLCAFGAGKLLDAIQKAGNCVLGIPLFGQQVLGGISIVFCISCIVYMRCTIMKEQVMKQ